MQLGYWWESAGKNILLQFLSLFTGYLWISALPTRYSALSTKPSTHHQHLATSVTRSTFTGQRGLYDPPLMSGHWRSQGLTVSMEAGLSVYMVLDSGTLYLQISGSHRLSLLLNVTSRHFYLNKPTSQMWCSLSQRHFLTFILIYYIISFIRYDSCFM